MNKKSFLIIMLIAVEVIMTIVIGIGITRISKMGLVITTKEALSASCSEPVNPEQNHESITRNNVKSNARTYVNKEASIQNTSEKNNKNLQKEFASVVKRYRSLRTLCEENDFTDNEGVNMVLMQTEAILDEMSSVNLNEISENELKDITESIDLLTQILDELDNGIQTSLGSLADADN